MTPPPTPLLPPCVTSSPSSTDPPVEPPPASPLQGLPAPRSPALTPQVAKSFSYEVKSSRGLHKYHLEKELGKGSFGCVYLARRRADNAACALKVISKASHVRNSVPLMREVSVLSLISHPAIIKLESYFSNDRFLFLELEYVTGGDLQQFICKRGPLGTRAARFYTSQLVLALDALHSQGIIHRDVKPDNVLIGSDGYIKLTDFNLATRLENGKCYEPYGTLLFMAPEVLSVKPYGIAADWWALGVTLYAMLFGTLPFNVDVDDDGGYFTGAQFAELLRAIQSFAETGLNVDPSLFHQGSADFLLCLLAINPSERELTLPKVAAFPWFRHIDFVKVKDKAYAPPILPDQSPLPWDPTRPGADSEV